MTTKKAVKLSFEERLQEAGQIADSLSGNQLTLDESMHAYERGMTILNQLEEELKNMCNEIIKLYIILNKEISKFPFTLSENEYIILLIIMTKDEKVMFPLMCKNTDKLNKIKEIFFKEFPEYSDNNGNFYCHNNNLLKNDETLEECKIKTNDIIIFDYV